MSLYTQQVVTGVTLTEAASPIGTGFSTLPCFPLFVTPRDLAHAGTCYHAAKIIINTTQFWKSDATKHAG